ncbi:MAG: aminotransferase class I/II-fold pyridoxal phosphate-dependent enzyme, partial [Pseudomonadota bacterium]
MNPGFSSLQAYPFERLRALYSSVEPANKALVNLSIGEPQHPTPSFIQQALVDAIDGTGKYPSTRGSDALRSTIAGWLTQRFELPESAIDPDKQVLPVNGTREALFAIAQTIVDRSKSNAAVVMPNPFYQIYEGAALLAGAEPIYLTANTRYDFDSIAAETWNNCQLVYVCSPGNPSGEIINSDDYRRLFELANKYDFVIVADECYSELYFDETAPPL